MKEHRNIPFHEPHAVLHETEHNFLSTEAFRHRARYRQYQYKYNVHHMQPRNCSLTSLTSE